MNLNLKKLLCSSQDTRFNHDIDARTGYKTHSLLCMPIKDFNGEVMGVAQVSFVNLCLVEIVQYFKHLSGLYCFSGNQ